MGDFPVISNVAARGGDSPGRDAHEPSLWKWTTLLLPQFPPPKTPPHQVRSAPIDRRESTETTVWLPDRARRVRSRHPSAAIGAAPQIPALRFLQCLQNPVRDGDARGADDRSNS